MARARFMSRSVALVAASVLGTAALTVTPAHAQPTGQDVATAQALFDEGKRLMQAGKYEDGCPKLVESQRLDPAGGTLLVIALCHEGQGKTATAWAEFGVALGEARKDKRSDRESAAQEHIKALEPKLTKVRIVVTSKVEGLEIRRDGARVGEAQWGTPLPIDPGEHPFEARAPGKQTWSKVVPVKGDGATVDVTIPALADEDDVAAVPAATTAPAPVPAPDPTRDDQSDPSGRRTRLTWAVIAGGVGLVATGVGVVFAASASSKWSDAEKACPDNLCTSSADLTSGKDAGSSADLATVFFVLGGVGLAAGAVLWFTAPSAQSPTDKTAPRQAARSIRLAPSFNGQSGGFVLGGSL